MVSLWPWRADTSSTASFEKTLSTLSAKIADTQSRLDRLRTRSRRTRLLSTIYLVFAYLVYAIVLLLVVGYKNMGAYEWTGMAGGPVIIYTTRTALATYYSFRIETLTSRVKEQREERAKTIEKLKEATKYDSTMELIEKYGGTEGKKKEGGEDNGNASGRDRPNALKRSGSRPTTPGRTNMAPPSTANIKRPGSSASSVGGSRLAQGGNQMEPGAEFAPNAEYFPEQYPSQPAHSFQEAHHGHSYGAPSESQWYDRVFDLLLGEDETAPKNRIVLICQSCRLVNGQAPPGTRALSDLGVWKCMGCGALNGEMDEGRRLVKEALEAAPEQHQPSDEDGTGSKELPQIDVSDVDADQDGPAAAVKRRRHKAR